MADRFAGVPEFITPNFGYAIVCWSKFGSACGGGGRGNDSAYLGPKFSSVYLGNGNPPQNTTRPDNIAEASDAARQDFRRHVNEKFLNRRRTAVTEAFAYSYEQAEQLMRQRDVFDVLT